MTSTSPLSMITGPSARGLSDENSKFAAERRGRGSAPRLGREQKREFGPRPQPAMFLEKGPSSQPRSKTFRKNDPTRGGPASGGEITPQLGHSAHFLLREILREDLLAMLYSFYKRCYRAASHPHPLTQAPCTPALAHASSLNTDRARNARAPTSPRRTGFCAPWGCISSSSSSAVTHSMSSELSNFLSPPTDSRCDLRRLISARPS